MMKSAKGKKSFLAGLLRDVVEAFIIVAVIVIVAYTIAGTWPVMVAVESSSMEPNIYPGDLVFIARDKIIAREGGGSTYISFKDYGDVIVYQPYGDRSLTPIIHRAIKRLNESERPDSRICINWRDVHYYEGAPYAGYVMLGDNNKGKCDPIVIKQEWIIGVAKFRVPYLGYVRAPWAIHRGGTR